MDYYDVRYGGQSIDGVTWGEYFAGEPKIEAQRHLYKNRSGGRTLCGGRSYKTGYSPCELAYNADQHDLFDKLYAEWKMMMIAPSKRLSTEDFQAACDLNGLSRCNVAEAQLRVKVKHALRAKVNALPERPSGLAPSGDMSLIIEALNAGAISTEEAYRRAGIDRPAPAEQL